MLGLISALPVPIQWALSFLVALFPLVLAHEFGHFLVAKWNRMRVDEFGIGFPPRALRLAKIGETEYTLNWLPIGGFVRLAGENDPSVVDGFASHSKKARAAVLLAGSGANLLLAALILVGLASLRPVAQPLAAIEGASLVEIEPGSPAELAGLQQWDIAVAVDGRALSQVPLASPVDSPEQIPLTALRQTTRASTGSPLRLTVLRGAQLVKLAELPGQLATRPADLPGVRGRVVVKPTADGLLQTGDLILGPASPGETELLAHSPIGAGPLVLRGVQAVEATVTPRPDEQGIGRIGVTLSTPVLPIRLSLRAATLHGLRLTGQMSVALVTALVEMVRRTREVDLRGPLGIAEISRQASEQGADALLGFMALLSVNFAVINLLPIPALDGGRLLFIAAEAIRGRRIEPGREALVHLIGFALVLTLMVVLTFSDLAAMSDRFRSLLDHLGSLVGVRP